MLGRVWRRLAGIGIGAAIAWAPPVIIARAAADAPSPPARALAAGENPYPVRLVRPPAGRLSAMAELGRAVFFDRGLSASGRLACASCHSPADHYGPPGDAPTVTGGPHLADSGIRAVPSLMYLERQPNFSIGPDNDEIETVNLARLAALGLAMPRARKTAGDGAAAAELVPQGGLFWDGRADTLQAQALGPLLSPTEMAGGSIPAVAARLRHAPYAARFVALFGAAVVHAPDQLVAEAMFAVARYQIEAPSFHPYSSKFDAWLEGKARLTSAELRGYRLFNDPQRANCGGCHLDQVRRDGLPPMFTDYQYEALGAPRNAAITANHDPRWFDLGICGPIRADMRHETQYCGMFLTPTLRNVATRRVFFHNGVFHSLRQVLDFYNFRDTRPERIYPRAADGSVAKFNDIPQRYRANVDVTDPPFDRSAGGQPAMSPADEEDLIAYLSILTDGYEPADD